MNADLLAMLSGAGGLGGGAGTGGGRGDRGGRGSEGTELIRFKAGKLRAELQQVRSFLRVVVVFVRASAFAALKLAGRRLACMSCPVLLPQFLLLHDRASAS
jgi:hypothetical protein